MRGAGLALLLVLGGGCSAPPGPAVHAVPRPPEGSVAPERRVVPEDLASRIAGTLEGLLPEAGAPEADRLVVVDAVRLTGSPVGGPVAAHLRDLVVGALSRYPERVSIVEEERTDEVLERLARWQGELYDPTTAPAVGKFSAARYVVEASYIALGEDLRLSLQVRDIQTLRLTPGGKAAVLVPLRSLPAALALEPGNADRVNHQLARWREEVGAAAFRVEVWTDRGLGARYRPGERLRIYVRSQAPGRLKVVHMDVAGKLSPVFPNAFHPDDRVEARRVLEIPDETMAFELTVAGSPGVELVHAVCTAGGLVADGVAGYTVIE